MAFAMIHEPQITPLGAGADLTAGKYLIVKAGTVDGTVVVATATSERLIGVLQTNAATSATDGTESVEVCTGGVCLVRAGGTVTRGLAQMFSTGSKVEDAGTNVNTIGIAQQSGVSGDLVSILVTPGGTTGTG